MIGLPKVNTEEWQREIDFYLKSTALQRNERAKSLGYAHRDSYQRAMLTRGVSIKDTGKSDYVPPENMILPIPKIELHLPPVSETSEKDEEQVGLFSDSHIGLKTKTYNSKVAKKRILRYYNTICRFADIHRKFCPVSKLHLFMLGDIPQGEQIGKQLLIDELELPLYDQKWVAVNELSNLIINLCQWYKSIDVIGIPGNHGVLGKYFSFAANWNIEIYDLLKAMIGPNYPQVTFQIEANDFYAIHKVKNTSFLALHGDKIPMYLSLPFYGIDRRSLKWKQSLPHWDILLMGHFHSCSFLQPSGFPIFINGTFSSDSRFVAQWLGLKEIAEQWTFFVGDNHPNTAVHKIDLMRE